MNVIPKKFLLAGGAGFIGSHLTKRLLQSKETQKVTVVDNYCTGSTSNLIEVAEDPRIELIEADVTAPLDITEEYDCIIHMAAIANPTDYEKSPVATLRVNSSGVENLVNIATQSKTRFIFFSSSEIYGLYDNIPASGLSEEAMSRLILGHTRSPYPIGKCFGEELTAHLCTKAGIKYSIVRPFNVYGPNMDIKTNYGRVIPNFIGWALKKRPLLVQGDGHQIRTFCYINDFIDALIFVIHSQTPLGAINIGSPTPTPIITLARQINDLLQNEAGIEFVDRYPYETFNRIPDIQRIKALGWSPQIDLSEGLRRTVAWFRDN